MRRETLLSIVIILCIFIIIILILGYTEKIDLVKSQKNQIYQLENKVTELERTKVELEKQNLDLKTEIDELRKLVTETEPTKDENGVNRIEINQGFIIMGRNIGDSIVQKEVLMTIKSVELREELPSEASSTLRARTKHDPTKEILLITKGTLTNKEKMELEVEPAGWLRILDAETETLYDATIMWPFVLAPESTLQGLTVDATFGREIGIVFVVPRDTTLFLRVTDIYRHGVPIELKF